MALKNTSLLIEMSPLPPTFADSPQNFAAEMVRRMRIVSATGVSFFFSGDTEPSSNVGPWLKGGTQWWVFDESTKKYVPLDISASEVFLTQLELPAGTVDYSVLSVVGSNVAYRHLDDNFFLDNALSLSRLKNGLENQFIVAGTGGVWTAQYFNPAVHIQPSAKIPLSKIDQSGATANQIASWNGSEWVPRNGSVAGQFIPTASDPDAVVPATYGDLSFASGLVSVTLPAKGTYKITAVIQGFANDNNDFFAKLVDTTGPTDVPGAEGIVFVGDFSTYAQIVLDIIYTTNSENHVVKVQTRKSNAGNAILVKAAQTHINYVLIQ